MKKLCLALLTAGLLTLNAHADTIELSWTPPADAQGNLETRQQITSYDICYGTDPAADLQTNCTNANLEQAPMGADGDRYYTLAGVPNVILYIHAKSVDSNGTRSVPSNVLKSDPAQPPLPQPDPPGGIYQIRRIYSLLNEKLNQDKAFYFSMRKELKDLSEILKQ